MLLKSFEELKNILDEISIAYTEICKDWDNYAFNQIKYNQSTTNIRHFSQDIEKIQNLLFYRYFLNADKQGILLKLSLNQIIHQYRIKQLNSVFSKLFYYNIKKVNGERGTIAVNKCFNDILGLRIITDIHFDIDKLKASILEYFPHFKCIDSSKDGYKAIHIYIKQDNLHYLWELQLWHKDDVENNYKSHKKHKEEYTEWERLTKEIEEVENV